MGETPEITARGEDSVKPHQPPELSVAQLAHELNSLLDGSLRSLALAQRALSCPGEGESQALGPALARLQAAQEALKSMADVLDRAMVGRTSPGDLLGQIRSLSQVVQRAVDRTEDWASGHDVELILSIDPEAANLPAGPLEPVILNGLRNAVESCISGGDAERRVELSVKAESGNDLALVIADTGGGVPDDFRVGRTGKPDGHGLGLQVVQQIVAELGGHVSLINAPSGSGAVLQIHVPIGSLASS